MKRELLLLLSLAYCNILQGISLQPATAQVTSDGTTNTIVNTNENNFIIQQGERAGGNLFHSFTDFSVPNGAEVFFNNATDIVNIFSRVTGGNISLIDGLLRTNGNTNLFLLNPSGIIFGENAKLDFGGSFYGSTADGLIFDDGEFSATNLNNPPLLTINVPLGLNFGTNPGQIVNRSVADGTGLEVATGQSLALVGENISLVGGILTASEGRIELGSVAGNSVVNLEEKSSGFDFQYDDISNFGNIELTQGAIIDTSGVGSGSINLQGNTISLQDGSQIRAATTGSVSGETISVKAETLSIKDGASILSTTLGDGNAGDISIEVPESIQIVGRGYPELEQTYIAGLFTNELNIESFADGTGILTATQGIGRAGNIQLNTSNLTLVEGAIITGFTFGKGPTGSLTINATESIESVSSGIFNMTTIGSSGNANRININTTDLILSDTGFITGVTFGAGDGSDISINAVGQIEVLRSLPTSIIPSVIVASSLLGQGSAGNINIQTKKLNLQDGGQIATLSGSNSGAGFITLGGAGGDINIIASDSIEVSGTSFNGFFPSVIDSSTYTNANAGNLNIETGTLIVSEGASVSASTILGGQGGNLTIDATESITISGTSVDGQINSSILSSSGVLNFPVELDLDAVTGDAGSLSITTGDLLISDHGRVAVSSLGSGNSGILKIQAKDIQLENQGQIIAETTFGEGGNITLDIDERLILRNASLISAKADENADGGNINIDTSFIVAPPSENSDIIANAFEGNGGNINITANGIFGLQSRQEQTTLSDITASSEFGLAGTVAINNPDVDPSSGLIDLPSQVRDPSDKVIAGCAAASGNSFTINGQGGFPEDPNNTTVYGQTILPDLRDFTASDSKEDLSLEKKQVRQQTPRSIVQVNGWIVNQDGEVELVAALPQETSFFKHTNCQNLGSK